MVQQRAGVHLLGGVGEVGDSYERNADAVAERVVRGESAQDLLTGGHAGAAVVQRSPAATSLGHGEASPKKADAPGNAASPLVAKGGAGHAPPAGAPPSGAKVEATRAGGRPPAAPKAGGASAKPGGARAAPRPTTPSRVAPPRVAPAPASPGAIDSVTALAPAVDARGKSAKMAFAETRAHVQQTAATQAAMAREEANHAAAAFDAHGAALHEAARHGAWEQSSRIIERSHAAGEAVRASGLGTQVALIAASSATTASATDLDAEERAAVRSAIVGQRAKVLAWLANAAEESANQIAFQGVEANVALYQAADALWTQIEPELQRASTAARDGGDQLATLIQEQAVSALAAVDALDGQVSAVFDRARGGAAAAASCQPGRDAPSAADRARFARGLAILDELVAAVGAGLGEAAGGFARDGETSIAEVRAAYALTEAEFSVQIGAQTAAMIAGWHGVTDAFLARAASFSHGAIAGHGALFDSAVRGFREAADKAVELSRRSALGDVLATLDDMGPGLVHFTGLLLAGAALILLEFPAMAIGAVFVLAVSLAGLTMLVTGLLQAAFARGAQAAQANEGKPWYRQILGQIHATTVAVGDTFGAAPLVEAGFGRDMVTGEELDPHERVKRATAGVVGLAAGRLIEEGVSRLPQPTRHGSGAARANEPLPETSTPPHVEPEVLAWEQSAEGARILGATARGSVRGRLGALTMQQRALLAAADAALRARDMQAAIKRFDELIAAGASKELVAQLERDLAHDAKVTSPEVYRNPQATLPNGKQIPPSAWGGTKYHGSRLPPEQVFESGLPARGEDTRLLEHVEQRGDSALLGTTEYALSPDGSRGAGRWAEDGGWVYQIDGMPSWDMNASLEGRVPRPDGTYGGNPMPGEHEHAMLGGVSRERIVAAIPIREVNGKLVKGAPVPNPNYAKASQ